MSSTDVAHCECQIMSSSYWAPITTSKASKGSHHSDVCLNTCKCFRCNLFFFEKRIDVPSNWHSTLFKYKLCPTQCSATYILLMVSIIEKTTFC